VQAQIAEGRELCPWLAYRSGDQFWLWRLSTGLSSSPSVSPWHGVACAPCLPTSGVSPHVATTSFSLSRCIPSPDNNSPCLRASCLRPSPHGTPSFRSKSCTSSVVHSWMCTCPPPPPSPPVCSSAPAGWRVHTLACVISPPHPPAFGLNLVPMTPCPFRNSWAISFGMGGQGWMGAGVPLVLRRWGV